MVSLFVLLLFVGALAILIGGSVISSRKKRKKLNEVIIGDEVYVYSPELTEIAHREVYVLGTITNVEYANDDLDDEEVSLVQVKTEKGKEFWYSFRDYIKDCIILA